MATFVYEITSISKLNSGLMNVKASPKKHNKKYNILSDYT